MSHPTRPNRAYEAIDELWFEDEEAARAARRSSPHRLGHRDGANRHDVRMLEPPAVGGSRARRLKGFRRRAGPPQ